MEYRLYPDADGIRRSFTDHFADTYEEFTKRRAEWISELSFDFSREYYARMFMWDKISRDAHEISFADALRLLKSKGGEVMFITEAPECGNHDFCKLSSKSKFAAGAEADALAECISYEWFAGYELLEQGRRLAEPILPEDLYVFDMSFSWCIIFTHETDRSESPDSRLCILVQPNP